MSKKTISLVLMVGGALLALVSLLADLVRIGSYPGFHGAQIGGLVAGWSRLRLASGWGAGSRRQSRFWSYGFTSGVAACLLHRFSLFMA